MGVWVEIYTIDILAKGGLGAVGDVHWIIGLLPL